MEVTFTSTEVMAAFANAGPKTYSGSSFSVTRYDKHGSSFSVTRYDKQILEARVRWLPVNVKDSVLRQIFEGFGNVISITDEVNKYGAAYIKDDFYSKIPTKNFFYFLPICSLKYA